MTLSCCCVVSMVWRASMQSSSSEIVPTVGFSVERFTKGGTTFEAFDMSGVVRVLLPCWRRVCDI
jgi:hypothetical protein